MTSSRAEIDNLQEQFNQLTADHEAENDKRVDCLNHGDKMGQQICLDRMKELGIRRIEIQQQIKGLNAENAPTTQ